MTIAMLPGMNTGASGWAGVVSGLRSRATTGGLALRPLPLNIPPVRGSVTDIAEEVHSLVPEGSVMVGHSFGGVVTMEMIRQRPGRYRGAVLIATPVDAGASELSSVVEPLPDADYEALIRRGFDRLFTDDGAADPRLRTLRIDSAREFGPRRFELFGPALASRPDVSRLPSEVGAALLVIASRDDPVVPPAKVRAWIDGSAAEFTMLDASRHLSILEEPQRIADRLVDWISDRLDGDE